MASRNVPTDDGHTPCLSCECCTRWGRSLELFRASAIAHTAGELRISPCDPECMICATIDWQARGLEAPYRVVAHAWPAGPDEGTFPCCGRAFPDVDRRDRVALHPAGVTCEGPVG